MKRALLFGIAVGLASIPVQYAMLPRATVVTMACATAEPGGPVTCHAPPADGVEVVYAAALPAPTTAAEYAAKARLRAARAAEPLPEWLPAGVLRHEADIHTAARAVGLDPLALAILVSIECPSGNPACGSYAGATGLGQVMPGTAASIQGATGYPCITEATDPLTSLKCGGWYYVQRLRDVSDLWSEGSESAALGGAGILYNAGPGWASKVLAHTRAGGYVCGAPVPAESRKWCNMMVDAWVKAGRQ